MSELQMAYGFGFTGAALMVTSYLMKSMLPLRIVALLACLSLVVYGYLAAALPSLLLYGALIPINLRKTWQIHRLVRATERARHYTPVSEWLLPQMTRRSAKAGTVLWRKGDVSTEMLYLDSGSIRVVEHGELLGPGAMVGEIGLFSMDHRRTLTLECASDCTLYGLSADAMARLYFQNPKLGFHVMQLIVARLMHDTELASAAAAAAQLPPDGATTG